MPIGKRSPLLREDILIRRSIGGVYWLRPYVYCADNPLIWMDIFGLYSFRQGLGDTAKYSGGAATISFLTPGGQVAAIVFTGIGIAAIGIEIAFYPDNIYIDTAKAIIKQLLPIKKPYDMFTDQLVDSIADAIKRRGKRDNGEGQPDTCEENP